MTNNHTNAAEMISLILQHEKSMTAQYFTMTAEYINALPYQQLVRDNRGHALAAGDEYVIVTCSNGYKYYVNVTCDSVVTMCAEVFDFIQSK